MSNELNIESNTKQETKKCPRCGKILPLDRFRIVQKRDAKPYIRSECRDCEAEYAKEYMALKKEQMDVFDENIEIVYERKYKEIHLARILDLAQTGLDLPLMGEDEIFVQLMQYPGSWLSNYGRMIRKSYNKYRLLKGNGTKNGLSYTVREHICEDGKWISTDKHIDVASAVIETFIVNPDVASNTRIWHRGDKGSDYYYRNLYPVTSDQYSIIRDHYKRTGEDSEEYILKVMNDIRFKPEDWARKAFRPTLCGVGYHGCSDVDTDSEAYVKWKNMIERCYNQNSLQYAPQYTDCTVCDEWLNFSNFRFWYETHKYGSRPLSLDKDILLKGNTVYCPECCSLVPKDINLLMISTTGKDRHGLPIGVYAVKRRKGKFRAEMNAYGKIIKIGTYGSPEEAFQHYKEYKETFIKKIAEERKGQITFPVYNAMMNWEVEITD